jgi:O-antigen/teichoic acid export membrane protein
VVEPEVRATGVSAIAAARSNLALSPLIAVAGLASSVVVVRVLAPDLFALYALALALRGSIQFLADMGTGAASTRLFAELQDRGARAQAQHVYIRLALLRGALVVAACAVVALAPDALSSLLNLADDERYFLVFMALVCAAEVAAGLGFYVLTGTFRHALVNRVTLVQTSLQPLLVILAALLDTGLRGILVAVLAGSVFRALALNAGAIRTIRAMRETGARIEGYGATYAGVAAGSLAGKIASWVHSRQFVTPIAFSLASRQQVAVFSIAYDWVHQALSLVSTPFYSLLLPIFSVRDRSSVQHLFRFATRALALVVLPSAAALLAVFPALSEVVFPAEHEDAYSTASEFAAVLVPLFAFEVILNGPATAVMLANEPLVRPYRRIRLLTLAFAVSYFALSSVSLLAVTAIMMGVRVASAVMLHAAIWRKAGFYVEPGWLGRALGVSGISCFAGIGVGQLVPGQLGDLVLVPATSFAAFLLLVRLARLLSSGDVALARRVLPFGHRALDALTHA